MAMTRTKAGARTLKSRTLNKTKTAGIKRSRATGSRAGPAKTTAKRGAMSGKSRGGR